MSHPEITFFDVILEIVKYFGVLTTAYFGYLAIKRGEKIKKQTVLNKGLKEIIYSENELKIKELFDLQRFSQLQRNISQIFKTTRVNRFGVMFAINGTTSFDYVTVIFDQKYENTKIGSISPYTRFAIDAFYKEILKKVEYEKFKWVKPNDSDVGEIATFMEMEEVFDSGWFFVERQTIDKYNDLIVYCIFSTSDMDGYTTQDKNLINLMAKGKIIPKIKELISIENLGKDKL